MAEIIGYLHDHLQKMKNTIMAKVDTMVEHVADKKVKPEQEEATVPPKATPCVLARYFLGIQLTPTFEEMLVDYEQTMAEEEEIERRYCLRDKNRGRMATSCYARTLPRAFLLV